MIRIIVIIILIAFVLYVALANAHSFYPTECCSGFDCEPINSDRVRETRSGYVVDEWHFVPHGKELKSIDGRYHACFPKAANSLRCLFVPPRGA